MAQTLRVLYFFSPESSLRPRHVKSKSIFFFFIIIICLSRVIVLHAGYTDLTVTYLSYLLRVIGHNKTCLSVFSKIGLKIQESEILEFSNITIYMDHVMYYF